MINFILKNNSSVTFGKPLTISELTKRLKKSPEGRIIVWGYIVSGKGKLYRGTGSLNQISLSSALEIEYLVNGPLKKPGDYVRFIAFTNKEKLEKIFRDSIHFSDDRFFVADKSYYYTEVYD